MTFKEVTHDLHISQFKKVNKYINAMKNNSTKIY